MRRFLRLVSKIAAVLLIVVLAGVGLLLVVLAVDHRRTTELPRPTGPLPVGRITLDWTDEARVNRYAPVAGTKQELFVWVWYPAATAGAAKAPYLSAYWTAALEKHEGFVLSHLLSRDAARVQSHSWSDAAVAKAQAAYPVVILRAGGGALTSDFTTMAEDLASNGYVVVGFDAPYRTVLTAFPDGRVMTRVPSANIEAAPGRIPAQVATELMQTWVADVEFVLDRLQALNAGDPAGRFNGRLDMGRVGVAGHSLGGATALQVCHEDARCKAGIDIDGMPFGSVVHDGVRQAFLFLMSDHSGEDPAETSRVMGDIDAIYQKAPEGKRWEMTIAGANHFSFSDQMFTKSAILIDALHTAGVMKLEKRRGMAIATDCVRTFFDVTLKGAPVEEMGKRAARYPEIKPGLKN
jgi:predicted dienelactone hydrolase